MGYSTCEIIVAIVSKGHCWGITITRFVFHRAIIRVVIVEALGHVHRGVCEMGNSDQRMTLENRDRQESKVVYVSTVRRCMWVGGRD